MICNNHKLVDLAYYKVWNLFISVGYVAFFQEASTTFLFCGLYILMERAETQRTSQRERGET